VTVTDGGGGGGGWGGGKEVARLAAGKGLVVEEKDGTVSLVISAATPEEALAQLGLFSAILAAKA
jgi:hypothetical protein